MVGINLRREVHPAVLDELRHSRDWYEARAVNLGHEFLEEIDLAIETITNDPEVWPVYDRKHNVRRFLVHRFPYAVYYRYLFPVIQIIAVANLRRRPGYWKSRLRGE